jgi:hypothetical protein
MDIWLIFLTDLELLQRYYEFKNASIRFFHTFAGIKASCGPIDAASLDLVQ